jgi:hypothetical protein
MILVERDYFKEAILLVEKGASIEGLIRIENTLSKK